MWKWFKWVLICIGIIIIAIGIAMYCYYIVWMKMGPAKVKKAEAALSKGISLNDAKNDFVIMGSNKEEVMSTDTNNPNPYQIDYLDIKSVQIGADENYIYAKVYFYNTIPKRSETKNGDKIETIGIKLHIMDAEGVEQTVMHFDYGWQPVMGIGTLNTSYDYCPTGIEWPEEARMACHGDNSKISGGGGTNYILAALPMAKIGLKPGDITYISVDEETRSSLYSHAAVDVLQGTGKMAGFVTWKIGSKEYKIDNNFFENSPSEKANIR